MAEQTPRTRIVITGISRGIGRSLACVAADAGYAVAGIHRNTDPRVSEELAAEIEARGGTALIRTGDVGSTPDVDALADAVADAWGGIDIWVNNAARLLVQPFLEMTDEDWLAILNSNLLGYVRGARAAARLMVPARSGRIINVSSVTADQPPSEMTGYVTSKGGITGLTRSLAVELGEFGVTVNAIAPGATDTPLNLTAWSDTVRDTYTSRAALKRIGSPEEVADAILMFGTDAARFITGQIITVDGGLVINGTVGHQRQ